MQARSRFTLAATLSVAYAESALFTERRISNLYRAVNTVLDEKSSVPSGTLRATDLESLHDESDFPVLQELLIWNRALSPVDRKTKLCAMLKNPFIFYRGADHLFFRDFALLKRKNPAIFQHYDTSLLKTWIQGDLHTDNFGAFGNGPGDVVFNVNDFDESMAGDIQFDLWRLAASVVIESRVHQLLPEGQERDLVQSLAEGYRLEMQKLLSSSGNGSHLEMRPFTASRFSEEASELASWLKRLRATRDESTLLDKWAPRDVLYSEGKRRFPLSRKLTLPGADMRIFLAEGMMDYYMTLLPEVREKLPISYFRVKDIAQRDLAGTGSLGAGRYYVLIDGPSADEDDDVILDVKQQQQPAPALFLGDTALKNYVSQFGDNHALRHNVGYRKLTRDVDMYLGYLVDQRKGVSYAVRSLSPYKDSFPFNSYRGDVDTLKRIISQLGRVLAVDHVSSLDKSSVLPTFLQERGLLSEGYNSFFPSLLWGVGKAYAERVFEDFAKFKREYIFVNGLNESEGDISAHCETHFVDSKDSRGELQVLAERVQTHLAHEEDEKHGENTALYLLVSSLVSISAAFAFGVLTGRARAHDNLEHYRRL